MTSLPKKKVLQRGALVAATATAAALCLTARPASAQAAAGPAAIPTERARVVQLVNDHRAEAGCPALTPDGDLRKAAQRHSDRMAWTGVFSHRGPDGSMPWDRATDTGYRWKEMAENIARGQQTPREVVDAWMHSPPHRHAILNCDYRDVGIGVHRGPAGPWWTQDLGADH